MGWKVGPTKRCKHCGEEKPREAFRRIERSPTAVTSNCFECEKHVARELRQRNPQMQVLANRKSKLKRAFGMTLEQYDGMLERQGFRCAICGTTEPGGRGRFVVDHCHRTNKVRALLCNLCNVGIGALRDDPEIVLNAAAYLEAHLGDRY